MKKDEKARGTQNEATRSKAALTKLIRHCLMQEDCPRWAVRAARSEKEVWTCRPSHGGGVVQIGWEGVKRQVKSGLREIWKYGVHRCNAETEERLMVDSATL